MRVIGKYLYLYMDNLENKTLILIMKKSYNKIIDLPVIFRKHVTTLFLSLKGFKTIS